MKRTPWIMGLLLLFLCTSVVLWAVLPATDAFTASNGTALTSYSSNWSLNSGNFAISTNAVHPNQAGVECGARWNAEGFENNQYAQGRLANIATTGQTIGVAVRASTSGTASYYGFYADGSGGGKTFLFKMIAGTWTQLGSLGSALSANDVLKLEVSGSTLTPKVNGTTQSPPGAQSDSALSSGAAGLSGYSTGSSMRLDDWEGGNLSGAPVSPRPRRVLISSLRHEFESEARSKLAELSWFGPGLTHAQTTFGRFYIVPVIGSGTNHTDGRRPKYFDMLGAVQWNAMDYGDEPAMLVYAQVTNSQDAALTANPDVFALATNLDATLTGGQVAAVRLSLERFNIPADNWVTALLRWRQLLRTVAQMMQFYQRLNHFRGNARLFAGPVTLTTRWNQLSAANQSALQQAAISMGYSTSALAGANDLRTVLKNMADQWGDSPIVMGRVELKP